MTKKKTAILLAASAAVVIIVTVVIAAVLFHVSDGYGEYVTIATVDYNERYWAPGISYTRIIELQHSGEKNGTLIATYECATSGLHPEKPGYNIHISHDSGSTWKYITTVREENAGFQSEFNPVLYELPCRVGDMPEGTLLLAAQSIDAAHALNTAIRIYRSYDEGLSWEQYSTVTEAAGGNAGVWEPWLMVLPDGRLACYYSDCTDRERNSQKLVMKISEDGVNWGEPIDIVAPEDRLLRPGMITIARMNDGRFIMTYEMCNEADPDCGNAVHYRFSEDGVNWGAVTDPGTKLVTDTGAVPGSAPYVAYVPGFGENGLLLVTSVFQTPIQPKGNIVYLNDRMGDPSAWSAWFLPVDYDNSIGGYSHAIFTAADGLTAYFVNNIADSNAVDEGYAKMIMMRCRFDESFSMPQ